MSTQGPQFFEFLPAVIDRSLAPEAMAPNNARLLQNIDVTSLAGRLRRAPGYARADFNSGGSAATVNNVGIINRRDGKILTIWSDTAGNVKLEVPATSIDGMGLLDLWNDVDDFVDPVIPNPDHRKWELKWRQNFDEEIVFVGDAYSGPAS